MVSKEIVFQRDATREHIKVCLEVTLNPFLPILFQNYIRSVTFFYYRLKITILKKYFEISLVLFRVRLEWKGCISFGF